MSLFSPSLFLFQRFQQLASLPAPLRARQRRLELDARWHSLRARVHRSPTLEAAADLRGSPSLLNGPTSRSHQPSTSNNQWSDRPYFIRTGSCVRIPATKVSSVGKPSQPWRWTYNHSLAARLSPHFDNQAMEVEQPDPTRMHDSARMATDVRLRAAVTEGPF